MKKNEKNSIDVGEMSPTQYFIALKHKKNIMTIEGLDDFYNGCLNLVDKYKYTKQYKLIEKLSFLVKCVEKEKKIVDLGINSFVYREDIEDYIDNVSKNVVKIIELENYPRDIPNEIVERLKLVDGVFDKMYVVFTDYTGSVERQVEAERRDKDPILFGTFQTPSVSSNSMVMNDRFYFLGDWEDEYCDLTMDKFLKEAGKDKLQTVITPKKEKEIVNELNRLNDEFKRISDEKIANRTPKKKNWFQRIFNK